MNEDRHNPNKRQEERDYLRYGIHDNSGETKN